ncbi:putative ABC transporter ATP-binding protein YxlF [Poriferisphaera corsica]|uniref:Putative ABC transporter ATP-binding protein YxlF n=1 Tax=Poriferisphaera corsica TaxID=2528020 RepID=A0A517YTU6_9BACT|nr:ABC transporter ATP-binding protein [Poriferisphaera corsica]QDU33637.1 putative ABC transporter ATP-binding protein YxlF [Poriferisphaera corsica]
MIIAKNLVKWYGPTLAVDDLSFEIPKGEIVGFLGPNGAGKSTTLRILTGYLPPTAGSASIADYDILKQPLEARTQIGYLPEGTPLYGEARVTEYLHYRGSLLGMTRKDRNQRIEEVCDRCGLSHLKRRVISRLSKGNRQRVGLAQALLSKPPILILDEPTAALDPNQISEVRKLIKELRGEHTILLSTHILPEVEKTADRVMIIAGGRLLADGKPSELRQQIAQDAAIILEAKTSATQLTSMLKPLTDITSFETLTDSDYSRLSITPTSHSNNTQLLTAIGNKLLKEQIAVRELHTEQASLETFFVKITDRLATQQSSESA